jgi:hypothetical protein
MCTTTSEISKPSSKVKSCTYDFLVHPFSLGFFVGQPFSTTRGSKLAAALPRFFLKQCKINAYRHNVKKVYETAK